MAAHIVAGLGVCRGRQARACERRGRGWVQRGQPLRTALLLPAARDSQLACGSIRPCVACAPHEGPLPGALLPSGAPTSQRVTPSRSSCSPKWGASEEPQAVWMGRVANPRPSDAMPRYRPCRRVEARRCVETTPARDWGGEHGAQRRGVGRHHQRAQAHAQWAAHRAAQVAAKGVLVGLKHDGLAPQLRPRLLRKERVQSRAVCGGVLRRLAVAAGPRLWPCQEQERSNPGRWQGSAWDGVGGAAVRKADAPAGGRRASGGGGGS